MKLTRTILYTLILLFILSCTNRERDFIQNYPPYKLLRDFARKIEPLTSLRLVSYGENNSLPKEYQIKGIGNLTTSYKLMKNKNSEVPLDEARMLMVFVTENLLQEVNTNAEVREDLDVFPFTSDRINISIYFKDENGIDLGQGIANVRLYRGNLRYKAYDIHVYKEQYPAIGKHYIMHEESYEEALEIVKKEGNLTYIKNPPIDGSRDSY